MPTLLATLIYMGFLGYLLRREILGATNLTSAVWIPTAWLFTVGTRTPTQWLSWCGLQFGGITEEEGSPTDAAVYLLLIVSGMQVLTRRRINLQTFMRFNVWLSVFIIYCLISCLWSDYPFVSFKRWIKILGHPIMMLVLLTEPAPEPAMVFMMKLCGYPFMVISALWIKYFPQWGRTFDNWTGLPSNVGITTNKNTLGCNCMVFGLFFFYHFMKVRKADPGPERRNELMVVGGMIAINYWLISQSHSATSLVTLSIGMVLILIMGSRYVRPQQLESYLLGALALFVLYLLVSGVDFYSESLKFLGKDSTLTDRTAVWAAVLKEEINPLIGTGFEGFWLGERRERIWNIFWWQPHQAHNGYLETYLNLGLIGLALMIICIVSTFYKGKRELRRNFDLGRYQIAFVAAFIFYNITEAAFKALHIVWFIFYLVAMDYPARPTAPVEGAETPAQEPDDAAAGPAKLEYA